MMGRITMKGLWKKVEHFQERWVRKVQERKKVEKKSHQMSDRLACLKQWLESY